jgi:hypothetical protein
MSSALVNVGLLLIAVALIFALVVTGNPPLPSDPDSAAQGNQTKASTTTTTTTTTRTNPATVSTAAKAVAAWSSQYESNMKDLGTDEAGIDVADDELKGGSGGIARHNYFAAL